MFNPIRTGHGMTFRWIASAVVVGTVIGQLFATWLSLCGTSPVSLVALTIGFAAGAVLADWAGRFVGQTFSLPTDAGTNLPQNAQQKGLRLKAWATTGTLVAATLVALCWLTPVLMNATLLAGCETIGASWPLAATLTMLFPALMVAIVTACAGVFYRAIHPKSEIAWNDSALVGAVGVVVLIFNVWLVWPLAVASSAAVCLAVLSRLFVNDNSENPASRAASAPSQTINPRAETPIHFAAAGVLIVAVSEIMTRLMPGSLPLMLTTVSIAAAGLLLLTHPRMLRLLTPGGMNTISLLILACVPMMFLLLADLNLSINTSVNSSVMILLLRAIQCAVLVVAALGPACNSGALRSRASNPLIRPSATFSPDLGGEGTDVDAVKGSVMLRSQWFETRPGTAVVLPIMIGVVLSLAAIARGVSPAVVLGCGIVLHAVAAFAGSISARPLNSWRILSLRRLAVPAMVIVGPVLVFAGGFDTAHTTSLLFSSRTAAAMQRGVDRDLIPQSDANRLITVSPMSDGEITVWRRAGNVFEFQRNGMSLGRVSSDTTLSPQPVEEILPAILPLVSHPQPERVLLLGDDTGACLRTCSHFPVQEIVAVRNDWRLTELARRFTWSSLQTPPDQDDRIAILHEPSLLSLRRRELKAFDVVIVSSDSASSPSGANQYTTEFYLSARARMNIDGIFCQRFRLQSMAPEPLKAAMSTMMTAFSHVGAVQTVPGEILLLATNSGRGLIDPGILTRLQRDHVRREIASAGWDWSQVAVLPLVDAGDPIGIFSHERPPRAISISNSSFVMALPSATSNGVGQEAALQAAFGPHQMQIIAAVPVDEEHSEDHAEAQRRLTSLAQQLEILAGMPDQPWTYRKSLRMEMQRSPRPSVDAVRNGRIVRVAHPLDQFRQDYFTSLGEALSALQPQGSSVDIIRPLNRFTENFEPLLSHFAHYEMVRLHELARHPLPTDEFRHRLHIVFFTSASDASVRPVISSIQQLVDQPDLIADDADRYDQLNSLIQKLIERWEARTAWEPRSALKVQNDVDQSVRVTNRALELMEATSTAANVDTADFLRRRRFINAALISPLRDYRDQVLAHRLNMETPAESDSEDPNDMPLLLNSGNGLNTN